MHHFWLSLVLFLIYFPALSSDQGLPPLPSMPGMTAEKPADVVIDKVKPTVPTEKIVPDSPSAESQAASPAPDVESTSGDGFIDLGNYKLPKIKQPSGVVIVPAPPINPPPTKEVVPTPADPAAEPVVPVAPANDPIASEPVTPVPADPAAEPVVPVAPANDPKASEPVTPTPVPVEAQAQVPMPAPDATIPVKPVSPSTVREIPPAPDTKVQKTIENKQKAKFNNENKLVALTPEHSKFIQDELVMFLIPDDDVVLGKVSKDASLEMMDGKDYIRLFWEGYDYALRAPKDYETELFITTYNHHYVNYARFPMSNTEAKEVAFDAVMRGNIDNMRTMLDNYQILQASDKYGNSLLIEAVEMNDLAIARLLLLRGVDLYKINNKGESALSIAEEYGPEAMRNLMQDAVYSGKVR